jgi:hypothetical protein
VPTITLGAMQTERLTRTAAYAKKFTGKHLRRAIDGGIGHNLPQEALKAFALTLKERLYDRFAI